MLEFDLIVWCLGDHLVILRFQIYGFVTHPFHCFEGIGSFHSCAHCSFVVVPMDPRHRMASRRGGGGNVRMKRN